MTIKRTIEGTEFEFELTLAEENEVLKEYDKLNIEWYLSQVAPRRKAFTDEEIKVLKQHIDEIVEEFETEWEDLYSENETLIDFIFSASSKVLKAYSTED